MSLHRICYFTESVTRQMSLQFRRKKLTNDHSIIYSDNVNEIFDIKISLIFQLT